MKYFLVDLINHVSASTGISKNATEKVLRAGFEFINLMLEDKDSVEITGFGKFFMKHRNPRTGRNPMTGEAIPIPERYVPTWESYRVSPQNKN